eukprot:jgi/Undpi1/1077/HiC_scaffold_10.g04540.m1
MPHNLSRESGRRPDRGHRSSRKHDSSRQLWSSDHSWDSNNGNERGKRRGRLPHEHSLDSDDSGASIDTQVDRRGRQAINAFKRGRSSSSPAEATLFTHREERKIRKSLRRKLLSNDGVRLSRIERRLVRADRRGDGFVRISAFEDSLTAEAQTKMGASVRANEALWLTEKLKDRNGRKVAIFKIRGILESGQEENGQGKTNVREDSQRRRRQRDQHRSRSRRTRGSDVDRGRSHSGNRRGSEGGTSESDGKQGNVVDEASHPARWTVRQGTVGQWLYEAASPMEKKLFFEFVQGLEKFEVRNGLDHFRVRPDGGRDNSGASAREDATTVLHLGPMLKAAIRFYV